MKEEQHRISPILDPQAIVEQIPPLETPFRSEDLKQQENSCFSQDELRNQNQQQNDQTDENNFQNIQQPSFEIKIVVHQVASEKELQQNIQDEQLKQIDEIQQPHQEPCLQGVRIQDQPSIQGEESGQVQIQIHQIITNSTIPQNTEYANNTQIQNCPSSYCQKEQNTGGTEYIIGKTQQIICKTQQIKLLRQAELKESQDDFYVQLLQQKWQKRNLQAQLPVSASKSNQIQHNLKGSSLPTSKEQKRSEEVSQERDFGEKKNYSPQKLYNNNSLKQNRLSLKQKDNFRKSKIVETVSQNATKGKVQTKEQYKKFASIFKIKKIKDEKLPFTSQNSNKNAKCIEKPLVLKENFVQNKSEIISSLNGHAPLKNQSFSLKRKLKKNSSDLFPLSGQNSKQKQNSNDFTYQFSLNHSVQMMSHILQDRYYYKPKNANQNKIKKTKNAWDKARASQDPNELDRLQCVKVSQTLQKQNSVDDLQKVQNKIRKIIKRSPYGLLQIEVKNERSTAKITHLRILRANQINRIKKISKLEFLRKKNCQIEISQDKCV